LLERLKKHIAIPSKIEDVLELSDYAVQIRYPGDYYPVTKKEYEQAIKIAQKSLTWVKKVIKEDVKYYGGISS